MFTEFGTKDNNQPIVSEEKPDADDSDSWLTEARNYLYSAVGGG